jgi:DnaJ family protein A protein 2
MFGGIPFEFFERGGGGFPGFPGREEREPKKVDNTRYYELLGVEKNATSQDILKAYRNMARTKHPDKGGDPKLFAEITQAKEVLSDPDKRKVYDTHGEEGINKGMSSTSEEGMSIFDLLSGRAGARQQEGPKKCQDTTHELKVTLEEIYNGSTKKLAISRTRNCVDCKGKGGDKVTVCSECRGNGRVKKLVQLGPGMYSQSVGPCDECRGQGKSIDPASRCKTCNGKQASNERKVIEVVIDKGTPNHHKQNFHGEGDEEPGVAAGDVIIVIVEKEHSVFKRKKSDLIMTKKISLKEALTGYCFTLKHLDGDKVIQSAPGDVIKPGDVRTVEELGMPIMRTPYKFGNLFISFEVEFPKPKIISKAAAKILDECLPGQKQNYEGKSIKAIPFEKSHVTENQTGIHTDYQDEDDDEGRHHGGQRVQCSGTIF